MTKFRYGVDYKQLLLDNGLEEADIQAYRDGECYFVLNKRLTTDQKTAIESALNVPIAETEDDTAGG